jgi:hypothetical protein
MQLVLADTGAEYRTVHWPTARGVVRFTWPPARRREPDFENFKYDQRRPSRTNLARDGKVVLPAGVAER